MIIKIKLFIFIIQIRITHLALNVLIPLPCEGDAN